MQELLAGDEVVKWEYEISANEKLIATNRRLYRVSKDNTKIAVVFRKAIVGCEYVVRSMWPIAIGLMVGGILIGGVAVVIFDDSAAFWPFFLLLGGISLFFMCVYEVIGVKTLGGDEIKIQHVKYFQFKFEPQLLPKVKDICSLEDVQ